MDVANTQFLRRNSFNDKGSVDSVHGATQSRFNRTPAPTPTFIPAVSQQQSDPNAFDPGFPYSLDPLIVEDPLARGNNVGRNAFRIFQVQRAFSDAHRALVAALDWDWHADGEVQHEYPLLKCLLQSEDVVFDL